MFTFGTVRAKNNTAGNNRYKVGFCFPNIVNISCSVLCLKISTENIVETEVAKKEFSGISIYVITLRYIKKHFQVLD